MGNELLLCWQGESLEGRSREQELQWASSDTNSNTSEKCLRHVTAGKVEFHAQW